MTVERLKAALRGFALYRGLRFGWHLARDATFRQDQWLRWRRPKGMFQYRSLTAADRYPRIFSFLRERLGTGEGRRLLSFGCATGEEVFSLRAYLPAAAIKGIDINAHNIAVCRAKLRESGDARVEFEQASSAEREPAEGYDAVLCLAVFQHQSLQDPAIESCERYLRFEDFDRAVSALARCLKPGGYFAIRHADFRFEDAAVAREFEPVLRRAATGQLHPCFGRDNRRLPDREDDAIVFQKRPAA